MGLTFFLSNRLLVLAELSICYVDKVTEFFLMIRVTIYAWG